MPARLTRRAAPVSLILALAASLVVALPTAAQAGTLTAFTTGDGAVVVGFTADPGETNNFFISTDASTLSAFDDPEIVVDPSAGAFGCVASGGDATCPIPDIVVADMGDGDDKFSGNGTALPVIAGGGAGADRVFGGELGDILSGDAGDDLMVGYGGDDELDGGDGDDILNALDFLLSTSSEQGAGADTLIGGPGTDWVDYDIRAPGVSITLDGVANDGEPGEQDDVRSDIERLEGSTGDDTIVGDDNAQEIDGDLGADRLSGRGGADRILGKSGNDEIDGGAGPDVLFGDFACTTLSCGGGSDTLLARDGERDEVACGPDADSVVGDSIDGVETSTEAQACETVDLADAPAGGGAPPVGAPPGAGSPTPNGTPPPRLTAPRNLTPAMLVRGFPVRVTSAVAGRVRVTLTLPARLARRLRLRSRTIVIGRGRIAAGRTQRIRLRLPANVRRKARRLRRSTLTLTVVVTGADGTAHRSSRTVRVR